MWCVESTVFPLAGEARWQPHLAMCSAFPRAGVPSPGYSCSMSPGQNTGIPRLSGSCLVDPVTPQELRTVRLPSSRCGIWDTEAAVSLLVALEEAAEAELRAAALGGAAELPGSRPADVREAMPQELPHD